MVRCVDDDGTRLFSTAIRNLLALEARIDPVVCRLLLKPWINRRPAGIDRPYRLLAPVIILSRRLAIPGLRTGARPRASIPKNKFDEATAETGLRLWLLR